MKQLYKAIPLILSALLILPTLQGVLKIAPESSLNGYVDPIPEKPNSFIQSFFDKSFQQWVEQKFNARVGFRAFLIRTFNEINFAIFREMDNSRLKLATSPQHGLYSNLTIDSLNNEILHKHELEKEYQQEAEQLLTIQNKLAAKGKYFVVVVASSKAYVYPEELGASLIVGGSKRVFHRAANFGSFLKKQGVHVIDSGPILRKIAHSNIETHPVGGLHWNFYSACVIAHAILTDAREMLPKLTQIDCTAKTTMPPLNSVDFDGYSLLNIWSKADLVKPTTYPNMSVSNQNNQSYKLVLIGDSFSDQIRFIFKEANVFSHMVMSSYFKTRDVEKGLDDLTHNDVSSQDKILQDINKSDIVILEMVDYNVHPINRSNENLYSFANYFLDSLSQVA